MLIFVIGLTLLTTSIGLAQVTKQNAIDTVLMNICGLDTTNFNVFMEPNVFNDDWFFLNLTDSLQNPYNYSWCFFIDENPNYHWSHDCSYLFLDTISGSYSRISHHFYPYNYKAEMEEVLLNFEDTTTWPVIQNPTVGVSNVSPDPNKYAVFICGDNYNPTPPYENFRWNNLSHMFSALKNDYGFTDENIFVFVPPLNTWEEDLDNDDVDDFDDACNLDNIDDTFEYLDEEMDEDDLLFVFGTSHGHSDMISESYLILEVGIAITEKIV